MIDWRWEYDRIDVGNDGIIFSYDLTTLKCSCLTWIEVGYDITILTIMANEDSKTAR
jgi:hypothetical protein